MATNDVWSSNDAVLLFQGGVGGDLDWDAEGTGDGAGSFSDLYDLEADPRAFGFTWTCSIRLQATTPVLGNAILIYKMGAPEVDAGVFAHGNKNAATNSISAIDECANFTPIGSVIVDQTGSDAADLNISGGDFEHYDRYLQFALFNESGAAINTTASEFHFYLTRRASQLQ